MTKIDIIGQRQILLNVEDKLRFIIFSGKEANVVADKEVPNFIKNRVDLRFLTVNCFNGAIELLKAGKLKNISMTRETQTIIITNFGVITGKILNWEENQEDDFFKATIDGAVDSRNKLLSKIEQENTEELRPINDSSFIVVKNANIKPYANPTSNFSIAEMILFTDQIVGLSAGSHN